MNIAEPDVNGELPSGTAPPPHTDRPVDRELVEMQLAKILTSREFARADRISRFLRYVVSSGVEGRPGDLKERLIGIEVFDRPNDWEPKIDNIVRGEARRLRTKLEQYYSTSQGDLVRISLPKGAYHPVFELLSSPENDREFVPDPVPAPVPKTEPIPVEAGIAVPPTARKAGRYWFFLILPIAALGVYGLLAALRSPTREESKLYEVAPFANEIGREIQPAISPDGKSIAYVWDGNNGNYDIYVKSSDGGPSSQPRRITQSPDPEVNPSWSPDGRTLAYVRLESKSTVLIVKDLITGEERRLIPIRQLVTGWAGENSPYVDIGPSWLPDGRSLVISDATSAAIRDDHVPHAIYRVSLDGDPPKAILESSRGSVDFFPRVSPDGRRVAFVRYISHGVSDLFLCDIDGSNLRRMTADGREISGLAWSSDGDALYFAQWRQGSSRIWRIGTAPGAQPERLPDTMGAADISVSASPASEWMAYSSIVENWNIWRIPLQESKGVARAGSPQRLIASSGRNHGPSFSRDGTKLAFISDRSGSWQIWLANPDGSGARQISQSDGSFLGSISWTPDSKTIAFDARPTGNSNIYLLDVAAGGVPKPLAANRFEERVPSWSTDGKSIYFNSNRDGKVAIWKTNVADGASVKVGLDGSFKALEANSGKVILFSVFDALYAANPDGSQPHVLPDVDPMPDLNWVPAGDALYFTKQEDKGQIDFMAHRNGKTTRLTTVPGQLIRNTSNLAISPDRQWLLYAQIDQSTSDILLRRIRRSGSKQ